MKTVYQLIAEVSAELCKDGISKDRTNTQGQGYKFRGIDDVYNSISPIISKHGLVILPRILSREITERTAGSGKALFFVVVEAEFDFVSSHDGSHHTVRTFGEAMDSGDKATNKAMSAAYKYAAFQAFCIPTEGDNDADATTCTVAPAKREPKEAKKFLTPEMTNSWNNAKAAFLRDGNLNVVLARFNMAKEHQEKLIEECDAQEEDVPQ